MFVLTIGDIAGIVCGIIFILLGLLAWVSYKSRKIQEKKWDIVIGEYDEEANQRNQSFIVGKGKTESE